MSEPAAAETFSAHAAEYDALRRRLVPDYDGFYGAVVAVLGHLSAPIGHVLDLGAGTGLLSAAIADAFPQAEFELVDASEAMLALATQRLGDAVTAVHVADMSVELPDGPFDAVVSALAIHHLEHAEQRRLFAAVHRRLHPGGVFVNAEQVTAPTSELAALYEQRWAEDCRALGAGDEELDQARERMLHDRCADVGSLLRWIGEAGFPDVDCVYKSWRFAVLVGVKEPAQ